MNSSLMVDFAGGMCTLLGTSTNLIVSARYMEDYPNEPALSLFSPGKYVLDLSLLCIYMPAIGISPSDCIYMPAIDRSLF